jgi:hypothetical protein
VETLVKDKTQSPVKTPEAAPARPAENDEAVSQAHSRGEEINELLRIKKSHRIDGTQVPCPSCGMRIEITVNRCPFCESDTAAETALARETTRRLRELSGELDVEHGVLTKEQPPRRGFFQRLKYLFEGDPEPAEAPRPDPHAKRLLGNLASGDTLKVLEEDGPWLKVKTMGSEIGWIYSTIRKS